MVQAPAVHISTMAEAFGSRAAAQPHRMSCKLGKELWVNRKQVSEFIAICREDTARQVICLPVQNRIMT